MTEGLTRRRGAGTSSANNAGGSSAGGSPAPSAGLQRSGSFGGGSAVEGRPKVAYDPRDYSDDNEAKKVPRLTLMEEVLLLGLKDKAVRLDAIHCSELAHGISRHRHID